MWVRGFATGRTAKGFAVGRTADDEDAPGGGGAKSASGTSLKSVKPVPNACSLRPLDFFVFVAGSTASSLAAAAAAFAAFWRARFAAFASVPANDDPAKEDAGATVDVSVSDAASSDTWYLPTSCEYNNPNVICYCAHVTLTLDGMSI